MEWTMFLALTVCCLAMYIGEVVSIKLKGLVPQMLVVSIIFLVGFWTIFPKDILAISGIQTLAKVMMGMILIHVGSMFELKDLVKEWKTVVTVLFAMVGIVAFVYFLAPLVIDSTTALIAIPPLTGGGMAALIMNNAAVEAGKPELGMLPMLIFVLHGFVGFPLTAIFLNKESKRLKLEYRNSGIKYVRNETIPKVNVATLATPIRSNLYELVPEQYRTSTFYITVLVFFAFICEYLTGLTGINNAIIQVLLGMALRLVGILEPKPLSKTESNGILTLALFVSFMGSFAFATVDVIIKLLITIAILMALSTIGLMIASTLIGKRLGFTTQMSIAIGLNCYLGFPFNYGLTMEAIKSVAENEEEEAYLHDYLMPKMIVAGIVSVSICSAILAGIVANIVF
ncbi:Hypothetical protein Tpal_2297 [Trichococcus palustris]|uniref:Na+/glutamate symporter n=1 Tax=Trichococcus palustris TaxID=140314 RepID=A0A143YW67_9LACT|nr:hypothetical protein [Trichococcus palustris]CZQ98647.1 Hypothetical protein Tpal_2297 [Trichococcus palustris]SFK94243.1 hypothetical protein SAMN04488076_11022 [Trichococcus palustris]